MKTTLVSALLPSLALAANIASTCPTVSIDQSSGVVSGLCLDSTTGEENFSQLNLNSCLAWNASSKGQLVSSASGNFTKSCSSCSVVNTPTPDQLSCSCGNSTSSLQTYSYDLTTLVINTAGCLTCLSTSSEVCIPGSSISVGTGSTGSGSTTTGGSSFSNPTGSGDSSLSGENAGSSDSTFSKGRRFRA